MKWWLSEGKGARQHVFLFLSRNFQAKHRQDLGMLSLPAQKCENMLIKPYTKANESECICTVYFIYYCFSFKTQTLDL